MSNPFSDKTDPELVLACLEGRQEAWEEIVERYSNFVYSIAWKYRLRWNLEVEFVNEIYQSVWLKVLNPEKLGQLKDRRKLPQWIGRIALGECVDYLRSMKKNVVAENVNVAETEDLRKKLLLELGLSRLSHDECRRLIKAIYYKGLTHKEVSKEMEIPLGSVSKMLRDNFAELAQLLSQYTFFELEL